MCRFVHDALTMDRHTKDTNTPVWRNKERRRISAVPQQG